MSDEGKSGAFYALLIGCDDYVARRRLAGCVNDIDAVEGVLLGAPGIGVPAERFRITRLAAALPGAVSTTLFAASTREPTRCNILAALDELARSTAAGDRVLIYYSGHGDQVRDTSGAWRECLVPIDAEPILDVEVNALLHRINARTADVTIVLDSCHSGGATRALAAQSAECADRFFGGNWHPVDPDPEIVDADPLCRDRGRAARLGGEPQYAGAFACLATESAGEGRLEGERPSGVFTHSLMGILREIDDPAERARLRWGDLWPGLLDRVDRRAVALRRKAQRPWLVGRPERRVFGGSWTEADLGFAITPAPEGAYRISAGALMSVSKGAELGVYGPSPARFPPLDSEADRRARIGSVRVVSASPSVAVALPLDGSLPVGQGARARLVRACAGDRLKVAIELEGVDASPLSASGLLDLVEPDSGIPEAVVWQDKSGDWVIASDVERDIAHIEPMPALVRWFVLRSGLEHLAHYAAVLRQARNCNDLLLDGVLAVRLVECAAPTSESGTVPDNANRPDAPRDEDRIFSIPSGYRFAIEITSLHSEPLQVSVLNCGAGGEVEFMDAVSIRGMNAGSWVPVPTVVWRNGEIGRPFRALSDFPQGGTDRLVVLATTSEAPERLDCLRSQGSVADVIREARRSAADAARPLTEMKSTVAVPAEKWTAVIVPLRIGPRPIAGPSPSEGSR